MGLADALIPGVASSAANLVARKQLKFKEFTSSGTFVVGASGDATSAATVFNVLLVGGGGGGGMGSITALGAGTVGLAVGGAGGGGEVREFALPGLTILNGSATGTVTVTIGAGGVGGASSNGGTAAVGGDSSFGSYTSFGGGRAGSNFRNLATTTSVSKKYRATGASSQTLSVGTPTAARVTSSSGGGGGARFSDYAMLVTSDQGVYFYGPQNGKIASGTADSSYSPDSQLPPEFDNNASDASLRPWCGLEANTTFSKTTVNDGWYGRGGMGIKGLGGGGAGAIASYAGTTIAEVLILPANYWATDYNQAYFYSVDGGGRGAIVTGNATANYIAATSGTANTGGGGGAGAAWATATTVYNSVSSGGSGAAGYCLVYWWE